MMKTQISLRLGCAALLLIWQTVWAQTWTLPENVTNNVDIFDQDRSLDIGPAPFLSGEAAHIAYNRIDVNEIYYAMTNNPVPVELVRFNAIFRDGKVHLEWVTASESNNFGFEVERRQEAGRYRVEWNGRDQAGREVASGVYIASLRAGSFSQAIKMIKIQ